LKRLALICFLVVGFAIQSGMAESSYLIYPHEQVIQVGDNMEWANPEFNHEDWDARGPTDSIGVFWVRFKIKCDSFIDLLKYPGIQVISLGSYEFYWDGHLIAQNGIVGKTKDEEVPGKYLTQIPLADSLVSPGIHTIALRVSNFRFYQLNSGSWNNFFIEEYQSSLKKNNLILTAIMFILAGIYLMAALYYLFLFVLRDREQEVFIFSVLCFLFFGLIIMEYVKFLYTYPYHWHTYRLLIIFLLTLLISFLTPYFLTVYFNLSHRKWISLGIIICLIIATSFWGPGADLTNENLGEALLYSSLAILSYQTFKVSHWFTILDFKQSVILMILVYLLV